MAKKVDTFQQKISRNDRFAQMSQQEKIIEQKRKEILAKLEAKELDNKAEVAKSKSEPAKAANKSVSSNQKEVKNIFSNDGSFLDQFKQMKDKSRLESKIKSFGNFKENSEKNNSDEKSKLNRWAPRRRSPSPKDRTPKRFSRFSNDKVINFEPKITINTSFSSTVTSQNFDVQNNIQPISVQPHEVTGQPLLKNMLPQQHTLSFPELVQQPTETVQTVITAPPVLLDVPPPQIVQRQISNTLVLTQASNQNVLVSSPLQSILTTVNLPPTLVTTNINHANIQQALPVPPPCLPTIELTSIPPPSSIQMKSIPQTEPVNTLNIPQPAPLQIQNIPTPNQIHLNEIPNPKPMDLLAIPTPNEDTNISGSDFLSNISPPNKPVPPPQLQENSISLLSAPQGVTTTITVPSTQNLLLHNIPPPQLQTIQNLQAASSNTILQNPANFSSVTVTVPVGVVQVPSAPTTIPSLMAQPILPPPGMGINVNCPPPILSGNALQHATNFVSQQPAGLTQQMPPMTIPPPSNMPGIKTVATRHGIKHMNAVFPPGSPEYESMASLGRTVAECGESIEDIVRQGKNQDPNLWFLFHKDSTAYQQYRQLVEQFKREKEMKRQFECQEIDRKPNLEDIYEPEQALEDSDYMNTELKEEMKDEFSDGSEKFERKRKRKSRWGDKAVTIPPPSIVGFSPSTLPPVIPPIPQQNQQSPVMISKVTRTDPALLQYVTNTYGSTNLSEEDWKKAEDNYKIHILYQDMLRKREEVERLQQAGKNKYEYDSDEDTEGGTWEHKAREKEMTATQLWAQELNRQAEGKHHIGDFLPPDELKKFMEKSSAAKEGRQPNFSDYKEFKIKEDNIGFKMLQKLGWTEGEGLGSSGSGIVEPVNKGAPREHTQGLGLNEMEEDEDEYESYRKRMMLAYRFRPNPLNNPRRPYY